MARSATIRIDVETAQGRASLEEFEGDLSGVEVRAKQVDESLERLGAGSGEAAAEIRRAGGAVDEFSGKARTMRRSASASANNLGFELVQAAQDARFGMAGVANQIPLMSEQFTQLTAKTGSTSGALRALGGSLLGPAGIIGAITLGLPLIGQLTSELFSAGDAAEEAGESASGADEEFRGLLETAEQLNQGLPNLEQVASDLSDRFNDLRDAGITNFFGLAPGGGLEGQLQQIQAGRGVASSVRNVREALRASSEEGKILQDALRQAGVNVDRILTGGVQNAREEIESNVDVLRRFAEDPIQLIEDPQVAAQAIRRQFRDVSSQLDQQAADGLIGEEEQVNQRIQFLRERLQQASSQFDGIGDEEGFRPLLQELQRLQRQAADETERQEQAMNGLAVSAKQAAENMVTVRRALGSMDQMPMQRRISNFGAGFQAPTVGGTMLRQGRSQGDLMLQAARDAGLISEFGTLQDTLGGVEQESQSAFSAVQLGAQAATSATNALTQSLARGESFARGLQETFSQLLSQVGSSLLQKAITGGSALGLTGGPLAAIGIGGGLLGGVLGSFDRGGIVDTPLQVVGESGPELAALPQGTRVSTARETERMLSGAQSVNVNIETELRRLPNGDLGVAVRESQRRKARHE